MILGIFFYFDKVYLYLLFFLSLFSFESSIETDRARKQAGSVWHRSNRLRTVQVRHQTANSKRSQLTRSSLASTARLQRKQPVHRQSVHAQQQQPIVDRPLDGRRSKQELKQIFLSHGRRVARLLIERHVQRVRH